MALLAGHANANTTEDIASAASAANNNNARLLTDAGADSTVTTGSTTSTAATSTSATAEDALNSHQKKMALRNEVFNKARAQHMKEFQTKFTMESQVSNSGSCGSSKCNMLFYDNMKGDVFCFCHVCACGSIFLKYPFTVLEDLFDSALISIGDFMRSNPLSLHQSLSHIYLSHIYASHTTHTPLTQAALQAEIKKRTEAGDFMGMFTVMQQQAGLIKQAMNEENMR